MKNLLILILTTGTLFLACHPQNAVVQSGQPFLDLTVKKWLNDHRSGDSERLAITIKSAAELKDYPQLRAVNKNLYSGQVSWEVLQKLASDSRVLRISGGSEQLH